LVEHSLGKGEVIGSIPIISSMNFDEAREPGQDGISGPVNTSMEQSGSRIPFQQAALRIEKLDEFEQFRSALAKIFAADAVEDFLRLLQRKGVPIRDFDRVLREKLLERADRKLAQGGASAQQLYDALPVSDQAQVREFYLTALEAVDLPLREKYNKLYRYY
jgi:hypothetical protein